MVLMARRITITLRGYHPTRIKFAPQTRVAVGNSRTDHRDNRFTRALGCNCGTAGIIGGASWRGYRGKFRAVYCCKRIAHCEYHTVHNDGRCAGELVTKNYPVGAGSVCDPRFGFLPHCFTIRNGCCGAHPYFRYGSLGHRYIQGYFCWIKWSCQGQILAQLSDFNYVKSERILRKITANLCRSAY